LKGAPARRNPVLEPVLGGPSRLPLRTPQGGDRSQSSDKLLGHQFRLPRHGKACPAPRQQRGSLAPSDAIGRGPRQRASPRRLFNAPAASSACEPSGCTRMLTIRRIVQHAATLPMT
jgi:hypothetical protein